MLPVHLAENIRQQVLFYLQSTFDFRDREVDAAFLRFLEDPESGLFKGAWVQLKRPFRPASEKDLIPLDVRPKFLAFKHQIRAWQKLSTRDPREKPRPAIVTTGTGSGKTECFLFPILDHCLRAKRAGQKGIKAIILYPMNALASDQEKRFAKTVHEFAELREAGIRVGNYTGRYDPADPGASASSGTLGMGPDHGISNHEVQQADPPDILLTNYKMLDYLLIRPQDQRLWRFNGDESGESSGERQTGTRVAKWKQPLQYLVLDELHTYDGAQGADVACLLRRLKERLDIAQGELCVVGTSATLDDREPLSDSSIGPDAAPVDVRESSAERLARFASTLFEEDIRADAVVTEDRLSVAEMVAPTLMDVAMPSNPDECLPGDDEDAITYTWRQSQVWSIVTDPFPRLPEIAWTPSSERSDVGVQATAAAGKLFAHDDALSDDSHDEPASPSHAAVTAQLEAWALQLGDWLKRTKLFRQLLDIFDASEKDTKPLLWRELVEKLTTVELGLLAFSKYEERSALCASFFALIAQAKELRSGKALPLVPTQVQIWIRELRRIGRIAHATPSFCWLDEPAADLPCLPTFHCSECGESGWIAIVDHDSETKIQATGVNGVQLIADPKKIYREWFGYKGQRSTSIVVLSPRELTTSDLSSRTRESSDGSLTTSATVSVQKDFGFSDWYLCPKSLVLRNEDGPCPLTADHLRFPVQINRDTEKDEKGVVHGDQGCPHCGSKEGVFFIGSQAATLSSVAIDELFGSTLNQDAKLLAFTDSVQDASHRAGFFSARTYQFTFRTALQHVIDFAGPTGIPLPDAGRLVLEWWSQPRPAWRGGIKNAMASLMPPDLRDYTDFVEYRDNPSRQQPPAGLLADIQRRVTWEATSEVSLMQTHGRTLETAASACVAWDEARINQTVTELRAKLPKIDPLLESLSDDALRLWLYGFLHRFRLKGALDHPYLVPLAKTAYWGKSRRGAAPPEREVYPPAGRFRPRLIVTQTTKGHECVLTPTKGSQAPWHLVWSRRVLPMTSADETSYLDLIAALLEVGTENGLFRELHLDGTKRYYAIAADAARLVSDAVTLKCSQTDRLLVRPSAESQLWLGAPSVEYYGHQGRYEAIGSTSRQRYYQKRYRKGVLRRVVAQEHTGLLETSERETLEKRFKSARVADDPNVLTCTSTLEMGIDIGDLSSTMLCSIPPNTANYLQRIGRAGRSTGTALIVALVNQRPHDLFFYGRPFEMLRGKVDPPGCWLDASAVLVRQYLAFAFDTATKTGVLRDLPRTGKTMVEDLARADGNLPRLMEWLTKNENTLQTQFLRRFQTHVKSDTQSRFLGETRSELLSNRLHQVASEFDRQLRDLENARKRLRDQLAQLDKEEQEAQVEINQELRILQGRAASLSRTTTLELLTDNGLLPNYAFPERGVRFYGSIYNKHRGPTKDHAPIEIIRPAGAAIKELAPANHFYTHGRRFDVQEIALGHKDQPLIEQWAVCGACGHMRLVEELTKPDAVPACPQCGHGDDSDSQLDLGQRRNFIEFSRSQAVSQMEHYESLSSDHSDERERMYYHTLRSFDLTREAPSGAVGEEKLPFGIEYRASIVLRDVNSGFYGDPPTVPFGIGQQATTDGFRVCQDCGVAIPPSVRPEDVNHRRRCSARRKFEKQKQEGRTGQPFTWESVYLYRQLQSEAIRLLLPIADDEDLETLTACLHLGLRQRFEGNPAHLIVAPQIMPDNATGMNRYYLTLLDAVPGGTGYLKTLYQEKDAANRDGEGIMHVLRLAKGALENCACRQLRQSVETPDPDGCYRCLRTYHQQYNAAHISRERGISLLEDLIRAGDQRVAQQELASIRPNSLFGSMLEKKFVDTLKEFVDQKRGKWEQTIIRGNQGFRFSLPNSSRLWEIELQPKLGLQDGVTIASQPDFMLRTDDDAIRPIAVFVDGFKFHCEPPNNRLADDFQKRRAILSSGRFHVWSVTWDDLQQQATEHVMVCPAPVAQNVQKLASDARSKGRTVPDAQRIARNGWQQLTAFLDEPHAAGWTQLATFMAYWPLQLLAAQRSVELSELCSALARWRSGNGLGTVAAADGRDWVYNDKASLNQDVVAYIAVADTLSNRQNKAIVLARLGDSDAECTGSDFLERWRRFLAGLNLYQFVDNFQFWAASEVASGSAPEIPQQAATVLQESWKQVLEATTAILRPTVEELAKAGFDGPHATPVVEHFNEQIDDDAFAELAWPALHPPVAVLVGDQAHFASQWQQQGWRVVTPNDLQARGISFLIDILTQAMSGAR